METENVKLAVQKHYSTRRQCHRDCMFCGFQFTRGKTFICDECIKNDRPDFSYAEGRPVYCKTCKILIFYTRYKIDLETKHECEVCFLFKQAGFIDEEEKKDSK